MGSAAARFQVPVKGNDPTGTAGKEVSDRKHTQPREPMEQYRELEPVPTEPQK